MPMASYLVLFGPQGSGKGTQAEYLVAALRVPRIAPGDIFRREKEAGTDLGKLVAAYTARGELAPLDITNSLMEKRLGEADCVRGFILDGYPRNVLQADALDGMLRTLEKTLSQVFEIWISDDEAVARIGGRRVCACGASYHVVHNPPKKEGICDSCGKPLSVRDDDKPDAIKRRLEIYHHDTEPLFERYRARGIFTRINGEQSISKVREDIFTALTTAS